MLLPTTPTYSAWKRIGFRSHIGIDLPLSALRSKNSSGIGEFLDLLPLIDWCAEMHMDVIQLLPLNDSGSDPSPYNALSSCALYPIYLSLHELPYLDDPELFAKIEELQKFNSSPNVAFSYVRTGKMLFLSLYFKKYGRLILDLPDFKTFVSENNWLQPYALFKALKDKTSHIHYLFWPQEFKNLSPESFQRLALQHSEEISFYLVLQYLCYVQLSQVKKKAVEKGILLKGDIPILISTDSADVWHHTELFNLDVSAGAPPDMYAQEGQYWGFPGFHGDAMKKDDFSWWKERLSYASRFYDIYRLDHAIGLFRLWSIPIGLSAKEGTFIPPDETLWGPKGEETLGVLCAASSMLPIAEDLGTVPLSVRPTLEKLGICGTKVLRWERDWNGDRSFLDPKNYIPLSMSCVSTHDSPTLAQWWRDYPQEAKAYAEQNNLMYDPTITQEQRIFILKKSNTSGSLFHINLFSEYLALVPELVWPNPDAERINIPGAILSSNWTYRFRMSIEEIVVNSSLKEHVLKTF